MATTLSTAPPPSPPPPPRPSTAVLPNSTLVKQNNFLSNIDMTTLTQTELSTLSALLSPSLLSSDDLVVPSIDRSVFNESAGSRRQTYSRPSPTHHRHRIAGSLLPSHHHHNNQPNNSFPDATAAVFTDDSPHTNHSIIASLKKLLSQNPRFSDIEFAPPRPQAPPPPLQPVYQPPQQQPFMVPFVKKRKRGRKPKPRPGFEAETEMGLDIVNKHGAAVDVVGLASLEDPFREEIRRRTGGMENEEQLLGFLTELGGQWCSRRRKRKTVDACMIGDALPVGWKLLLGLKRKEGRAWVYVRRYVSPGGKQFVSCKEVSAYLQSYFGLFDANRRMDHGGDNVRLDYGTTFESPAGVMHEEDQQQLDENEIDHTLLEENLEEVQIHDLFECHKCNMSFDEKDTYLQHLLSFHQRTSRRYRVGSSVGNGVIIKDGKYECQFCHKVFDERRRYNGHVGIHVRNYVRRIEDPHGLSNLQSRVDSPAREELPVRISKMDALIEIAQNSIIETSAGPNDGQNGGLTADIPNMVSKQDVAAHISDNEMNSDSSLSELEMDGVLYQQHVEFIFTEQKAESINWASGMLDVGTDSKMDSPASSVNVQNANPAESVSGTDGQTLTAGEYSKSGIEQEPHLESHSLAQLSNLTPHGVEHNMNVDCINTEEHPKADKMSNDDVEVDITDRENIEVDIGFGNLNGETAGNVVVDTAQQTSLDNTVKSGVPGSTMFSTFNEIPQKGESEFCSIDQRHDHVAGFEEMRFDEIENLKFSFGNGQESLCLTEVPTVLADDAEMENAFGSSAQFERAEVMLDVAGGHELVTVCVWCGIEFSREADDSEEQSDSVGYMCQACKTKISGQFNALDGDRQ